MKSLVVYSSQTGNTRKMADAVFEALPGERIRAQSGAACAHVARLASRLGLCGVAFLAGIPGTMGGALALSELREDGFVMDDGTSARLGEGHYLMTTTTAAAGRRTGAEPG